MSTGPGSAPAQPGTMFLLLPLRKIRRNGKYLFFGAVMLVATFTAYLQLVAPNARSADTVLQHQINCLKLPVKRELHRDHSAEVYDEDKTWSFDYIPQPWKSEYKGQANLHVFEDWCGSSISKLRRNLHYPLFPHSRSTVKKLAVFPSWTNYGLRIFGYIHPYASGEFLFAVASDDNSEFWLSSNESPDNLTLCAYVGMTGKEWTAPGEYGKFVSQKSQPIILKKDRRYYFELIHKQNDRGTDHVEVVWRLVNGPKSKFEIITSDYLSLYTNESSVKMNDVSHIPQTTASHVAQPSLTRPPHPGADMLREDLRDTFYQIPLMDTSKLKGVLPDCAYKPSYIIKGFPLTRYQGLQFVHLLYVYPNDHTRLTHMENDNKCVYRERSYYLERYGFSRYMKLDKPENNDNVLKYRGNEGLGWKVRQSWENFAENAGEEDDLNIEDPQRPLGEPIRRGEFDDFGKHRQQKMGEWEREEVEGDEMEDEVQPYIKNPDVYPKNHAPVLRENGVKDGVAQQPEWRSGQNGEARRFQLRRLSQIKISVTEKQTVVSEPGNFVEKRNGTKDNSVHMAGLSNVKKAYGGVSLRLNKTTKSSIMGGSKHQNRNVNKSWNKEVALLRKADKSKTARNRSHVNGDILEGGKPKNSISRRNKGEFSTPTGAYSNKTLLIRDKDRLAGKYSVTKNKAANLEKENKSILDRGKQNALQGPWPNPKETLPDEENVDHNETNKFKQLNRHMNNEAFNQNALVYEAKELEKREERNALDLNPAEKKNQAWIRDYGKGKEGEDDDVKGDENLRKEQREVEGLWEAYKDSDFEDDLINQIPFDPEVNWGQTFQVSQLDFQALQSSWIDLNCNVSGNLLIDESEAVAVVQAFMEKLNQKHPGHFSLQRIVNVEKRSDATRGSRYLLELELLEMSGRRVRLAHYIYLLQSYENNRFRSVHKNISKPQLLLCNPRGFKWNPAATVHFIVPVKNQARWVQQFIVDMEKLYRATGDENFSIIITDFSSTDMDIKKTLENAHLPSYQYLRLEGDFQRAAGLQAGIDLVTNKHSILLLCDLHIHFPLGFTDSVRRHCVEGYMAFAPIVMRLNCGATPQDAQGYWEVNGFGLLGIYKSDLDFIGGMNTKDFTVHWGGEDWELLDRILEGGLEVERLYLRNFFHYHHSRRGMWNRQTVRMT